MNLIIDIGNTQTKAAIFSGGKLIALNFFRERINISQLKQFVKNQEITAAILCSVVNHPPEINKFLKKNFRFIELNEKTKLPIKSLYKTPKTLGKDRIASAVGANHLFHNQNVLVIDAGTCIKYDFVNSKNEYLGGAISPGIDMRFKALNNFTGKLPIVKRNKKLLLAGRTTAESILSGVQNGTVCEILGIIKQYRLNFGKMKVVLTGGDAVFLNSLFSAKNRIFASPNLTLTGLNIILNYNWNSSHTLPKRRENKF